jgi:histidyl-tRNA synthetase
VSISSVKGFRDVLPQESARRRRIVDAAVAVLESYGYEEIELPMLERLELFSRSVGQTSDIVEKEMYAFADRDGTVVALRPEGTAAVARAYTEAGLARAMPVARLYYRGAMFRRERPQKGRYRQFSQIGAELLGRDDAESDAEVLCLVADLCRAAGVETARIEVNSLGDAACRPAYREALTAYGRAKADELCDECRARLERNPLRLLDCKNEECRRSTADAPVMLDYLCDPCRAHHERVLALAAAAGVELTPNPRMVRGLDYYCRTAFEIAASGLGSQDAIGGGGRYDGLVEALGGPKVAGVGFAFGLERLDMASGSRDDAPRPAEFMVAPIGDAPAPAALRLARKLRAARRSVELAPSGRKLKAQLARADKAGIRYVIIVGDDELASGRATVRDMVQRIDRPGCFPLEAPASEIIESVTRDT